MKTRICFVKGHKCLFHRWVEKEDLLLKCDAFLNQRTIKRLFEEFKETQIPPMGCTVEKVKNMYALIEFPDGHIEEIPPTTITFLDTRDIMELKLNECVQCD